jgi:hypothetical protein
MARRPVALRGQTRKLPPMPSAPPRRRSSAAPLGLAFLLASCAAAIEVEPKGPGKYDLTIENDFSTRAQGTERLLAKKAEDLCPDGYDRLKRQSIHKHRGVTEFIFWEIQCS